MDGKAFVRRAETVDFIKKSDHPDYEFKKRVIVGKEDSKHFDVSVYEVPPGKSAVPYHYHVRNEKCFSFLAA